MNNTLFQSSLSNTRIYDPAGANVNYTNNMLSTIEVRANSTAVTGFNVSCNATDFGIGVGDTLWIGHAKYPDCRDDHFIMLTNTNIVPKTFNINTFLLNITSANYGFYINFRSNSDNLNDKGFDITCKQITNTFNNVNGGSYGNSLIFNSSLGNLQVGKRRSLLGNFSFCFGNSRADGHYAFAATGGSALGDNTFSIGDRNVSNAPFSNTLGYQLTANTAYETIIGRNNQIISSTSNIGFFSTDPLFTIGNGNLTPSNALVVYKNANIDINGFTRLGKQSEGAPEIKMKEITTTSANAAIGMVSIAHGLTASKIISVSVLLEWAPNNFAPPEYSSDLGLRYSYFVNTNDINIQNNATNNLYILNKPVKILITYKE